MIQFRISHSSKGNREKPKFHGAWGPEAGNGDQSLSEERYPILAG